MNCNDFKLLFLGRVWECGEFAFENNPAIEIVRDVDKHIIYEKPSFDFRAYGELAKQLEILYVRELCQSKPITIYQNNKVVWNGSVRVSDISNVYNTEEGSYKSVEVLDANYNLYFETNGNRDFFTSWDFDCGTFDPVLKYKYDVWDPASPGTIYQRFLYPFPDVLLKAVRMVSEGTVTLVSDFFTNGPGENWVFGTGQQLAFETANFNDPSVTFDNLARFMLRSYRLVRFHYQENGQQFLRIEPYGYFFNYSDSQSWEDVRALTFDTNIERLYTTAKVGDTAEADPNTETTFEAFEFDSFEEQTALVSGGCGSGTELELTLADIIVDTDKIEIAVTNGQNDKTYEKNNFVIETDGISAIKFGTGPTRYYNGNFLNSSILRRWFTGISPVTVFPEGTDVNYWSVCANVFSIAGAIPPGGNFNMKLFALWFEGGSGVDVIRDPDNTLGTTPKNRQSLPLSGGPPSGTSSQPNAFVYTCTKAADYRVELKWRVGMAFGIGGFNEPLIMYGNVRHETAAGSPINTYTSPGVQVNNGQLFSTNFIDWLSPNITIGVNERLTFFASSNQQIGFGGGGLQWYIAEDSCINMLPCSEFIATVEAGDLRQIYNIEFDGFPMCPDDFERVRARPGMRQNVFTKLKEQYKFGGWVESLKYDLVTSETEVLLVSGDVPPFETPANCWVLYDCTWHDECIWFDNKLWCDN